MKMGYAINVRCDLCGTVVPLPAGAEAAPGWLAAPFELLYSGICVRDFCTTCLAKPFHEVIGLLLVKFKERQDDDE